jgi:hypothetical protein
VSSKNLWDCLPLIFLIQNGRVTLLIAMAENKKSEILWLVQLICLYMSALKDLLVDLAYTYP